jgi:hypothetical protein
MKHTTAFGKIDEDYRDTVSAYLHVQRHHTNKELTNAVYRFLGALGKEVRRPDWFRISDQRGHVTLCWESDYDDQNWPRRKLTATVTADAICIHIDRKSEAYGGQSDSARFGGMDLAETVALVALLVKMNDKASSKT